MSVTSETTVPIGPGPPVPLGSTGGSRGGPATVAPGKKDFITPAKICVALLLRNYVLMIKNPDEEEVRSNTSMDGMLLFLT